MGNQSSVKSHISNAERTGVFQLTKYNLSEFPVEILRLKSNLRTLDLSYNKLKRIPGSISEFSQLKQLTLTNNKIIELPEEMGRLKKLETIDCSVNILRSIPSSMSQLVNLRSVTLSHNQLFSFPIQLVTCKHLDLLDLSHNKITKVPEERASLQVSELNLNQNQITTLSDSIAQCPRLKVLRLEENCLPIEAITEKILNDSHISLLAVEGNLFEMKDLHNCVGYEAYMERYTATKKKMM